MSTTGKAAIKDIATRVVEALNDCPMFTTESSGTKALRVVPVVEAIRDEAVVRIRRQWADERRVYLALADETLKVWHALWGGEPAEDYDDDEAGRRIGDLLNQLAAASGPDADKYEEARLPL